MLDGNVARVLARLGAFAATCARRFAGQLLAKKQQILTRAAQPPAIGTKRSWNSAKRFARRNPALRTARSFAWCRAQARPHAMQFPPRTRSAPRSTSKSPPPFFAIPTVAPFSSKIPVRTTTCSSRACGNSPLSRCRNPRQELEAHLRATLGTNGVHPLEALPEARHGVTFRNITLLPFLVPVSKLPGKRSAQSSRVLPAQPACPLPISSATRKIAAYLGLALVCESATENGTYPVALHSVAAACV